MWECRDCGVVHTYGPRNCSLLPIIDRAQLYAMAASGELSGSCADGPQRWTQGDAPLIIKGYYPTREMTREDLGLPCRFEVWASTLTMLFAQAQRDLLKSHNKPDAPYAFWLGADAPKPIPYLPSQYNTYAVWSDA